MSSTFEIRNRYGFPIMPKPDVRLESAQQYVIAAKALTAASQCVQCAHDEDLQKVIQITNNWRKK